MAKEGPKIERAREHVQYKFHIQVIAYLATRTRALNRRSH